MPRGATGESNAFARALAQAIDAARVEGGVSTRTLIARSGLSANYYYKRIRGEAPFSTNDLQVLASALGIPPRQLFEPALATIDRELHDPGQRPDEALLARRINKLFSIRQAQNPYSDVESAVLASVADNAARLGRQALGDLRAGIRVDVDDAQLAAIANFFDVHPGYLLRNPTEPVINELDARLDMEDARLDLESALADTGVLNAATRAVRKTTADELRAIARAVRDAGNTRERFFDDQETGGPAGRT